MPKYRVYATEKRYYSIEIEADSLMDALLSTNRNRYLLLKTEDMSQRQFTAEEAELIPEQDDASEDD